MSKDSFGRGSDPEVIGPRWHGPIPPPFVPPAPGDPVCGCAHGESEHKAGKCQRSLCGCQVFH